MKKWTHNLIFLVALLAVALSSGNTRAQEEKPTASADVGVFSKYMWRGWELSDDSIVIQPSVTVGYRGFSLNLWGNLDTDQDDMDPTIPNDSNWNETDLTLSYERSFGPVNLGLSYIYYSLDGADDAEEFALSAGIDVLLSPTLTVYREVAAAQGWYLNFGVSHSFDLPHDMTLDLAGSIGYYNSVDDAFVEANDLLVDTTNRYKALHDGSVSVGLTVPFAKYFSLSPVLAYSFPLSDDADNRLTADSFSNDSDFLFGGFTISMSF